MKLVLLVVVAACASSSPEPRSAPGSTPALVASTPEPTGACRTIDAHAIDASALASHASSGKADAIVHWIAEHPELAKAAAARVKRYIEKLRAQLDRLEAAIATRCATARVPVQAVGRGAATVSGRVLMPRGAFPLAHATVTLEQAGVVLASVTAGACGAFRFDGVADGAVTLRFGVRSFGGRVDLDVRGRADVELRVDADPAAVAVIGGHFDAVEIVLAALGIRFTRYSHACLGDPRLATHRLVFVNCRAPYVLGEPTLANLRALVAGGTSLYFSDLTLPYLEQAWPDRVEPSPDGYPAGTATLQVADRELRDVLGRDTIDIRFNLGGWRRLHASQPGDRVLLAAGDTPYMTLFDAGTARVGFTSFHYSAQPLDDVVTSLIFFVTRL